jgi:predicted metal-dependent HD superfamily phosphohydrolase
MTPDQFISEVPTRAKIIRMMTEPHRVYHNLSHAMEVAWQCFGARGMLDHSPEALQFFYYAAFYHDIVYDPKRKDNESRSQDEFIKDLILIEYDNDKDYTVCSDVSKAILLTADHFQPKAYKQNARILRFLNADLWGLGADWETYMINNKKIQLEFNVSTDAWREGRVAWINKALDAPGIYRTVYGVCTMRDPREAQAKANLTRELKELQNGM